MSKDKLILPLSGEVILITGAAKRLGRSMALAFAESGADVIVHYNRSQSEAKDLESEIKEMGRQVWLIQADVSNNREIETLCDKAFDLAPVTSLINNASIFYPESMPETTLASWQEHHQVNLTAPFILSQAFAKNLLPGSNGTIINMLDWRALRPGKDHFAYTVTKAALAAMTKALAISLAPRIAVNAIALGAMLPPEKESINPAILDKVPMNRWADLEELHTLLIYLLKRPVSLTGQIIHLDGGRHLVK